MFKNKFNTIELTFFVGINDLNPALTKIQDFLPSFCLFSMLTPPTWTWLRLAYRPAQRFSPPSKTPLREAGTAG